MPITIEMDENDFERLTETSMEWGPSWRRHEGRFENLSTANRDTEPSYDWRYAFWMGRDYTRVILAQAFLKAEGHLCEVLWDMAEEDDGNVLGYLILTNFETTTWARAAEYMKKKGG